MNTSKRVSILLMSLSIVLAPALPALSGEGTTPFDHERLSLTLPAGWASGEVPAGSGKQVIGYLESESIPGATVTVACLRGFGTSYASARITGLGALAAALPLGQEMLQKPTKIKTDAKKTAKVEFWRGALRGDDGVVSVQAQIGVVKTKQCWTLMLGIAPETSDDRARDDFVRIVQSAR